MTNKNYYTSSNYTTINPLPSRYQINRVAESISWTRSNEKKRRNNYNYER